MTYPFGGQEEREWKPSTANAHLALYAGGWNRLADSGLRFRPVRVAEVLPQGKGKHK